MVYFCLIKEKLQTNLTKTKMNKFLSIKSIVTLALSLLLASCSVGKKQIEHAKVLPPAEAPVMETFSCGFGLFSFSGVLLCFGNDCTETGSTTTTLDFQANKKIIKTLSLNNGQKKTSEGVWIMTENCDIEINYPDHRKEFYKYHSDIHRLELLNSNRESYKGTLALLTTINQIN